MIRQLALPLTGRAALGRADFIAAPANANALAFIERWPGWPVSAAAIHGPAGAGKTHLATIWAAHAQAPAIAAAQLTTSVVTSAVRNLVIEDVDLLPPTEERDDALIALLDRKDVNVLLTGRDVPALWPVALADLVSRFAALPAFPVWGPDDALLAALARKLFADRQLAVSDQVVARMLAGLERTPGAIRAFVSEADARALAERRAVTERLVSDMLAAGE